MSKVNGTSQENAENEPSLPEGTETEQSGVVRKLKDGYGFIAGNDGKDYFFHWTAMQKHTKDFRQLEVGDRVEFLGIGSPKGPRAIEIQVVG